ncbi:DUF2085 domain-containing protein [Halovenus rubra]|uniref:DUF2085 domain-containing protein n=2 Tax=Halovenus rubra TaxID=869890 RepID=A0ABD5X545_9EURY|nr:DUF2085 domain-containing protein [Halovenus rubra]
MTDPHGGQPSTLSEIQSALDETCQYLLSHHEPSDYHRCYTLQIRGHSVHLCARCLGLYPGIAVGVGCFLTNLFSPIHFFLVALLPLPALIDWSVTHLLAPEGSNTVRTITGGLLGIGYGIGLGYVLVERAPTVVVIGLFYAVAAGVVLWRYYGEP